MAADELRDEVPTGRIQTNCRFVEEKNWSTDSERRRDPDPPGFPPRQLSRMSIQYVINSESSGARLDNPLELLPAEVQHKLRPKPNLFAHRAGEQLIAGILQRKRNEAAARQEIARELLGHVPYRSQPYSYHIWLELPADCRSAEFAIEARRKGVAVTPADSFMVGSGAPPNAIRVCLGAAETRKRLRRGLEILARCLSCCENLGVAMV